MTGSSQEPQGRKSPRDPATPSADPILRETESGFVSRMYLASVAGALKLALKHLVRSVKKTQTLEYPEEKLPIPKGGLRGEHYLKRDEKGRVRCVACYLCAAACPAYCIHIESAQAPPDWDDRDKYPARFEIDMLRCIFCGMCEEACPVDAIALSSNVCSATDSRLKRIYDKERLLANGDALGDLNKSKAPVEGFRRGTWDRATHKGRDATST
jgi:NADH-quinone oxidoreductase subunit I